MQTYDISITFQRGLPKYRHILEKINVFRKKRVELWAFAGLRSPTGIGHWIYILLQFLQEFDTGSIYFYSFSIQGFRVPEAFCYCHRSAFIVCKFGYSLLWNASLNQALSAVETFLFTPFFVGKSHYFQSTVSISDLQPTSLSLEPFIYLYLFHCIGRLLLSDPNPDLLG